MNPLYDGMVEETVSSKVMKWRDLPKRSGTIAVFLGAFDPPHRGHYEAATMFFEFVNEVWVVPRYRMNAKKLSPLEDRLSMGALTFMDEPRVRVLDEREHYNDAFKGVPPLNRTLKWYLMDIENQMGRGSRVNLLLGSEKFTPPLDYFLGIPLLVPMLGVDAPEPFKEKHEMLNIRSAKTKSLPEFHSTQIRQSLGQGQQIDSMVCPEVVEFIKWRGLYQNGSNL